MTLAPRSGLRALLALVLALGLSAVAQAAPPDLLDIPLDDEGATADGWVTGGCLGCSVADADAVLTKDFDRGARLALPAATGAAAGVRVDLGASRGAGSRVGFVVRVHDGGDAALDALRLTLWTDGAFGPSADLAGPRAFDVQAVSGGRYFVSFRSAVSTAALAIEMSSAADAAFDLEVLHVGVVAEADLAPYQALRAEGARGSLRASASCAGCEATGARRMLDGNPETAATARLDAGGRGWVRVTGRYPKPIDAGSWIGFVIADDGGAPLSGVPAGVSLSIRDGAAVVDATSDLRAEARPDGSVYVWSRVAGAADRAVLAVRKGASPVALRIRAMEIVPAHVADAAFPAVAIGAGVAPSAGASAAPSRAIAVAPNPLRGSARIAVAADGPVRIDAFDALGRHVAVVHDGAAAGPVRFDAAALAPGVYVLRATDADGAVAQTTVTVRR